MSKLEVYESPIDGLSVMYEAESTLRPDIVTDGLALHAALSIDYEANDRVRIYELGMGSAPFLSLLARRIPEHVSVELLGVDISEEAIKIAEINLASTLETRGNKDDNFTIVPKSWTDIGLMLDGFEIGYFNPPYLPAGEEVRVEWRSAPSISMYVEGSDDGLDHYRWLIPRKARLISPGGSLYIRTPRDFKKFVELKNLSIASIGEKAVQALFVQSEDEKREGRALLLRDDTQRTRKDPIFIDIDQNETRILRMEEGLIGNNAGIA